MLLTLLLLLNAPPPAGNVGMVTRSFVDSSRRNWEATGARPLTTAIWYPASADAKQIDILEGQEVGRILSVPRVADGAPLATARKKFPLVLLSHGTGGSALQMMWLGHAFAARGYIAAAVNHHGNTGFEGKPTAQGFLLYWERARDLSAVLDRVLSDPEIGPHVDRRRIAVAGFSLGGYTAIAVVGGRFDARQYEAFCASPERDFTCEPQLEYRDAHKRFEELKDDPVVIESLKHSGDAYGDPRIRAAYVIAPALGGGFTRASLAGVRVPVRLVVGDGDTVAPNATNAARYAKLIRGSYLTVLPGGVGHYTFLSECTPRGKQFVDVCKDADGVDRPSVHDAVAREAFAFFEEAWKK